MKSNLNPVKWNKRFAKAIEAYKKAVYQLAEIVEQGSTEFGRDRVVEMTCLEEKRVNYYNNIARLSYIDKSLMPEVVYETVGESKPKSWQERAKREGLKPSQLRKLLRVNQREYRKEKAIQCATWPKNLMLMESELNRLSAEQKEQAISRIKTTLKL